MSENDEKIRAKLDKQLVTEALRIEQSNARKSIAKMKSRDQVRGGGRKPYKQKGTGRARQGSIRAVQWVGGGSAFGSSVDNFERKINKKSRRAAISNVIEWKSDEGRIVVDGLDFDAPSTKKFKELLDQREITGKVLLIYESSDKMTNTVKSARNLNQVICLHVDRINLRDLLNCEWILTTPPIAERLKINVG